MLQRCFYFLFCFFLTFPSQGQLAEAGKGMPPLSITLTSGKHLGVADLPENKAVMFIYFAPDCHHCREFTGKLVPLLSEMTKLQIIMVSNFPIPSLQQFVKDFTLERFGNVKVGTEGSSFLLPGFFKIQKFPFTAVYNKQHKLVASFRQEPPLDKLLAFSKRL